MTETLGTKYILAMKKMISSYLTNVKFLIRVKRLDNISDQPSVGTAKAFVFAGNNIDL